MHLSVKGRNLEVTDALRTYAEEKVQRMGKYLEGIVSGNVVLSVEKHRQIAEVTLRVRDLTVRAEESTDDLYSSIDLVAEKLERQILRHKERIVAHMDRSGRPGRTTVRPTAGAAGRVRAWSRPSGLPSSRPRWRRPSCRWTCSGTISTCFATR